MSARNKSSRIHEDYSFFMFAYPLQVFQPQTPSVRAEAGQGGVGGGPKGQEAGQSPEGKGAGASRQRAARRLWRERWLVPQLHQQQRMLLTVTVFLKVSSYCAHLHTSQLSNTTCKMSFNLYVFTFLSQMS